MDFHFAPVQGHTDAAYRRLHAEAYGRECSYYSPFIRLEKDSIRPRDIKDIASENNSGIDLTPQIIFKDSRELRSLVGLIKKEGFRAIDLNMGCPFPLQTARGRGAATVANIPLAEDVAAVVAENPEISFSVKMRLGMSDSHEWRPLLDILNHTSLRHIALHPRTASQQYKGELNLDEFKAFLDSSSNPVVYNGEIKTPADIGRIVESLPGIGGIMIGRGLLGRPSLVREWIDGGEWPREKRIEAMLAFHKKLMAHYSEILCGDSQVISKISPFWEYAESEIGRKAWKALKKASNIAKYHSALALID